MKLLEYQAKKILARHGIPVPAGELLTKGNESSPLPLPLVLKAQIPAGGRKKAGGVIACHDLGEFVRARDGLFGSRIGGHQVTKVLAEEMIPVSQEYYLGVMYDTLAKAPVAIFAAEGGVEVEQTARRRPEAVKTRHFSATAGLAEFEAREVISVAGLSGRPLLELAAVLTKLAAIFLDHDCTLLEINPFVSTATGKGVALDCHLEVDDDALFRQPAVKEMAGDNPEIEGGRERTAFERQAMAIDSLDQRGVAGRLIEFDGDLGLIIGGGGASLTAFDAIRRYGGRPANYCEIGGNPSVRKTRELTKLILSKPGVKKIAVIMNVVSNTRVDLMARGVIKGVLELGRDPARTVAVFRVPGAWEEEGYKILRRYGVQYCDRTVSIDEAARRAVASITAKDGE